MILVAAVVHVDLQRVTIEMDYFDRGTPNTYLGVGWIDFCVSMCVGLSM